MKELARMHMNDPEATRVETLTASLVYLMTHYARTGCPRLAVCVSRHMQALALHPDAAPVLRDICAGLHGVWTRACEHATESRADHTPVH